MHVTKISPKFRREDENGMASGSFLLAWKDGLHGGLICGRVHGAG